MGRRVEINSKVIVDPDEVCSIQEEITSQDMSSGPSGSCMRETFRGSVMTLKNGRKIYVETLTPREINAKLKNPNWTKGECLPPY